MMRGAIIFMLLAALVWFGSVIVRLENTRYAYSLGMCSEFEPGKVLEKQMCLDNVQTRTNWAWHLYYALFKR